MVHLHWICQFFNYINGTEERINKCAIGYTVNPVLHVNEVFIEQVDKCLRENFNQSCMSGIRKFMEKNTCVITLVMFYDNRITNSMKVYRVLSCGLYYVIYNYVCIDYLCCQSKTISVISSDFFWKSEV